MDHTARASRWPWVVLDTETTGLDPASHRIIEIAAVTLDPVTLQPVDEWVTLLNPGRDTGPAHVHNITNEMVAAAPTFADIGNDLARYLDGKVLIAHNLKFDVGFLEAEFESAGFTLNLGRGFCTYRDGVRKSLTKARGDLDYSADGAHRALNDVLATVEVFRHCWLSSDEDMRRRMDSISPELRPVASSALESDWERASANISVGGSRFESFAQMLRWATRMRARAGKTNPVP